MEAFLGTIMPVAFNFAPQGWALCDGQVLSISQNTSLFALLGVQYGGDGRTTFALPDLRGRVAVGQGQGPNGAAVQMGEVGGSNTTGGTVAADNNGSGQQFTGVNYIICVNGIFPARQ